jgi:hypothetical protein
VPSRFERGQESFGAGLVFFERYDIAAFGVGQGFIEVRLGPGKIIAFFGGALGDSPRAT